MTPNNSFHWHNINWIKINNYVSNRQTKMVEAYKEGSLTELRDIQYQAMMSFEFRAFAVRRVVSNSKRNTPGIDNILWNNPKLKFNAIAELRSVVICPKEYKPGLVKAGLDP